MPSFIVGRLLASSCGRFPGPLRRLYLSSGGGVIAIMGYYVVRGISVFGVVRLELGQLVVDMVEMQHTRQVTRRRRSHFARECFLPWLADGALEWPLVRRRFHYGGACWEYCSSFSSSSCYINGALSGGNDITPPTPSLTRGRGRKPTGTATNLDSRNVHMRTSVGSRALRPRVVRRVAGGW